MENRQIKILAIDDNQDNLISFKALINEAFPDARIFTALNGKQGIEHAIAEDPDVILLDIIMPDMDGFEVCTKLKADKNLCEIPVVFVTAIKDDKEHRIHALEVGAEAFLAKPIDASELTAQIRAMVKIRKANANKRNENERLTTLVNERTLLLQQELVERKRIEQELIKAKEKAEESDRLKSAFLANMSHEIRTPLNSIIGFSKLISEKNSDVEAINKMKYFIEYNSNILIKIIDDIIDISKIEAGIIDFTMESVNLTKLLADINIIHKQLIIDYKKEHLELYCHENEADIFMYTDKFRINQILSNLILNAIKYTEEGSVEYGFDIVESNIRFFVKDTGIGISEKNLKKIFDRFYKGTNHETIRGIGLGLPITMRLIEKMDGQIWVESTLGKGSQFYFTLPFIEAKISDSSEQVKSKAYGLNGKLVLVAEDDDGNFYLTKRILEEQGAKVLRAVNGIEAVEICSKQDDIDFVLMDLKMPIMDGLEATIKIRELKKDLLIVALSAHVLEEAKTSALNAGCNSFISKPVDPDKLLALM
ncbi:MAG: response regulator [Salinivirgaceae bacterium]|jgi:signal transduction histidine kinase|nr:response regulator [Salinivirgaceae bacterium]